MADYPNAEQNTTSERVRERPPVYEIPYDDLERVRDKELALFGVPRRYSNLRGESSQGQDDDIDYRLQRRVRERAVDDGYLSPRRRYDDYAVVPYTRNDEVYDNRSSRRRDPSTSDSDSDSSRERRRRRRRHRRHRSEQPAAKEEDDDKQGDDGEGKLWYSMKSRREGNLAERNFDSSYDGILAGVAGAAIGAITARRFGGEGNRSKKILAGAAIGALGFNVTENWYRVYTEEKEERAEKKREEKFEGGIGGFARARGG